MSTAFYRLVWKEYREQRSLWLALVIAAVSLAAVLVAFGRSGGITFQDLMTIGITITVAFGVAAVAVAFAGEEDDGTAMWLRMFPLKTHTLLIGKLTAIAVGMVALLTVSAAFNAILVLLFGDGLSRIDLGRNNEVIVDWIRAAVGMATFILLTLACALRSHKVFAALGWSAGCMVLYAILLMNTEEGPLSPLPLAVTVLAVLAVYPSARNWHRGLRDSEVGSVAVFPGLSEPYALINGFLRGRDDVWSKRLIRAASVSPPLSRTMRVLLWRELRFALPFFRGCVCVAALLLLGHILFPNEPISYMLLFSTLVIIECGSRTFRHDQQQLNGLFWSQRGVAPALVWAIRSVVWFGVLGTTLAAICVLETAVIWMFFHNATDQQLAIFSTETLRRMATHLVAAFVTGSFVISQLMSMWVRKPVVAACCGLIGSIFYYGWCSFLLRVGIPLWLTAWPLIAFFLLAGFLTRRHWMDRRMSPTIILQRSLMIVALCLCMWPTQILWRAYEIPEVAFSRTINNEEQLAHLSAMSDTDVSSYFSSYGYSLENTTGPWATAWDQFVTCAVSSFSYSHMTGLENINLPHGDRLSTANDALDQILVADPATHRLPPRYRIPWSNTQVAWGTTNFLLAQAQEQFEAGSLDEALTRVTQAVKVSHYLTQEATSWREWIRAITCELFAMEVLHRMIADDRLTDEQLAEVESNFLEASSFWTPGMTVTKNRTVVYQQLLHRQGYLWEEYNRLYEELRNGSGAGAFAWPVATIHSSWAERRRTMNLIQLIANENQTTGLPQNIKIPKEKVNRWLETSDAKSELDLITDPVLNGGRDSSQERLFRGLFNAKRATGVMIVLQRYRRKHGHFPDSLLDLSEFGFTATDIRLREYSGSVLLGYARNGVGFSMPVRDNFGHSLALAPDQPILYSQGGLSPLQLGDWAQKQKWKSSPVEPNRIWFINGSTILGIGEDVGFWGRNPPDPEP